MSIERALTALEAIALALTTIAATHAPSPTRTADEAAGKSETKVSGSTAQPEAAATQRKRPSKTEVAKATGIKVEDQDTALVVAKALAGKPQTEAAPAPEVMDYEVLKRAVLEVGSYSEQGRAAVIKLLGDYGVKNAKEIQPELREEFHGILLGLLTDLQNAESETDDGAEFA